MAQVSLCKLTKTYGAIAAVRELSLDIADGELLVLVGPSGCGKTTLLRLIAGLEDADSGTIVIDGCEVTHQAPRERDVALVFQDYALWPHMTVRQNLSFGLRVRDKLTGGRLLWSRLFGPRRRRRHRARLAEIDRQVEQTAALLGIAKLLERNPAALSGGEQQRVAVGRALVRRPKVYLFDEPLSNLDAVLRVELRRELRRLHAQLQATMIYVTHDQAEAMTLGTRIAVVAAGCIRQLGRPLEVYHHPADRFVAGFVGSPPMNFWPGMVRQTENGLQFLGDENSLVVGPVRRDAGLAEGRRVLLGVRPEDLLLAPPAQAALALRGTVGLIEPLGAQAIVHITIGAATLAAVAAPQAVPVTGEAVAVHLRPDRVHWFDEASGLAIVTEPAACQP